MKTKPKQRQRRKGKNVSLPITSSSLKVEENGENVTSVAGGRITTRSRSGVAIKQEIDSELTGFVLSKSFAGRTAKTQRFFPLEAKNLNSPKDSLFSFDFGRGKGKVKIKKEVVVPAVLKDEYINNSGDSGDLNLTLDMTPPPLESSPPEPAEVEVMGEDPDRQEIKLKIDSNESTFLSLVNSEVTGNNVSLTVSQLRNVVDFIELRDSENQLNYAASNPGIGIASFDQYNGIISGYLHIAPKTLKPMSLSKNVRIVMWILEGKVTLRSTLYETMDDGTNYLSGKELKAGACVLIPPFTPYMLENRDESTPAAIGYVMVGLDQD